MRKLLLAVSLVVSGIVTLPSTAAADGCYLCGSGSASSCQQCRYGGSDTQDARKACEKKGCKISGTASCSSAANVKVCKQEKTSQPVTTAARETLECAPN